MWFHCTPPFSSPSAQQFLPLLLSSAPDPVEQVHISFFAHRPCGATARYLKYHNHEECFKNRIFEYALWWSSYCQMKCSHTLIASCAGMFTHLLGAHYFISHQVKYRRMGKCFICSLSFFCIFLNNNCNTITIVYIISMQRYCITRCRCISFLAPRQRVGQFHLCEWLQGGNVSTPLDKESHKTLIRHVHVYLPSNQTFWQAFAYLRCRRCAYVIHFLNVWLFKNNPKIVVFCLMRKVFFE